MEPEAQSGNTIVTDSCLRNSLKGATSEKFLAGWRTALTVIAAVAVAAEDARRKAGEEVGQIRNHSHVQFAHGICQECAVRFTRIQLVDNAREIARSRGIRTPILSKLRDRRAIPHSWSCAGLPDLSMLGPPATAPGSWSAWPRQSAIAAPTILVSITIPGRISASGG